MPALKTKGNMTVNTTHADTRVRRRALATSRRGSLLTLGGAALAGTLSRPTFGAAKKRKNKKKGDKRCKQQVASCQSVLTALCERFPGCVAGDLLPCCDPLSTCQPGTALDCAFGYFNELR